MSGDFVSLVGGSRGQLIWLHDLGIGYVNDQPQPGLYDKAYRDKYRALDEKVLGAALTAARLDLVRRHYGEERIVDVGIGGGRFVLEHGNACGWDVNPDALMWLYENGLICDPRSGVAAVSMWDSMEHMTNPSEVLDAVSKWVFLSTPIYPDAEAVLESKHFKPGEHIWYFTEHGLVHFMRLHGFDVVEANAMESALGRDSIGSYAFRRKH